MNILREYETMYVLRPDLEAERQQELLDRFTAVVADRGAQVSESGVWGKRRLSYEIDGHREGVYVLMKYSAATDVSFELERLFRISDDVLRYLTIRTDAV